MDGRRGGGEEDEKTGRVGAQGRQRRKEKERRRAGRGREDRGTESVCLRPARCSKTRWRVDGEATAAERPSCSLGYLPIKAGTLLFTREEEATANPTDEERAAT